MIHYFIAPLLLAGQAYARFGQEQGNGAIAAISALSNFGQSGQAATLAGTSIQFLLAAANPCEKLKQADRIVSQLGTDKAVIAAARGLVAAEQNFNPFVVSIPSICSDPTLPQNSQLRGVVPLIDPAVSGSDVENKNAAASKTTPFDASGLSVAQVMVANGFSNFTAVAADGSKSDAVGGAKGSASKSAASPTAGGNKADAGSATAPAQAPACSNQPVQTKTVYVTMTSGSSAPAASQAGACTGSGSTMACSAPARGSGAVQNDKTGTFTGFQPSTIQGLDFGLCVPTMKFEPGLNGRSATEFTFQAIDPLVNKGQQEALNPAIIANRIKDQMTNVCGANSAAKDAVAAALDMVKASGARNAGVAENWNSMLGFSGTDINPDKAPKAGLVGHT